MSNSDDTAKGGLIVLSAPSGTGKSTVAEALVDSGACVRAITATTRAPRAGEQEGVDYFYLTVQAFEAGIENGDFLEHAKVFDRYYGVPRQQVEAWVAAGRRVLLVIDVQGGMTIKENFPAALLIFLEPPDMETLETRLRNRSTDDKDEITRRLDTAAKEMTYRDRYDHCVVNDSLQDAVEQVRSCIHNQFGTTLGGA